MSEFQPRVKDWILGNLVDPDNLDCLDPQELDSDLTYEESLELLRKRYPTFWLPRQSSGRIKQIVFTKDLVEKIRNGEVQVTYRTTRKSGVYYVVDNRFKKKRDTSLFINVERSETINPITLTNEDAQLAGVDTSEEIKELFEKWYGQPIPTLHRNWFTILAL